MTGLLIKSSEAEWFVLNVKSRHEFVTNGELLKMRVETFLPFVRRERQWKDRKKKVDLPLFPGYLFVHIKPDKEEYITVLKTKGAVKLLSIEPASPTPVPIEEINYLKLLVESGKEIDVYPNLKKGTRVRVKKGVLKGVEGTLEKKESCYILLINIEILGRSAGLRILADDVEEI